MLPEHAERKWKALVVVASFDSLPQVIEGQAKLHLGDSLGPLWSGGAGAVYEYKTGLSLSAIAPGKLAQTIRMPTLIAHGTADPVVPIASGRLLFDALPSDVPKHWIEIPGAGHDDVLVTDFPIYAELAAWMLRHVARP